MSNYCVIKEKRKNRLENNNKSMKKNRGKYLPNLDGYWEFILFHGIIRLLKMVPVIWYSLSNVDVCCSGEIGMIQYITLREGKSQGMTV